MIDIEAIARKIRERVNEAHDKGLPEKVRVILNAFGKLAHGSDKTWIVDRRNSLGIAFIQDDTGERVEWQRLTVYHQQRGANNRVYLAAYIPGEWERVVFVLTDDANEELRNLGIRRAQQAILDRAAHFGIAVEEESDAA